ncbi:hypothetical protein MGR01S_04770 [Meiothermus granaticius NBRC 107808]|nr:hypothetical protein MGR01S_04770 [Meiothermus granaticius NBRC 107808]
MQTVLDVLHRNTQGPWESGLAGQFSGAHIHHQRVPCEKGFKLGGLKGFHLYSVGQSWAPNCDPNLPSAATHGMDYP